MFKTQIFELSYQSLLLMLILSAPPVFISTIVGLIISIGQAATQIQEQTLATTLKLITVVAVLLMMGGWMGAQIMAFANNIFTNFYHWK